MDNFKYHLKQYVKLCHDSEYKRFGIPKNHLVLVERAYRRSGANMYRVRYTHSDTRVQVFNVSEMCIMYDKHAERRLKIMKFRAETL
jgi:hypothetical protein